MCIRDSFPVLQDELADRPQAREFAALEGNCFFKAALENPNLWDRPPGIASNTEKLREDLAQKLVEFLSLIHIFWKLES